jgi:two-component system, LytTR family, response regulator
MTCIAIDDEPKALDILALFIAKTPFLDLRGTFRDPFQAMDFIVNSKPDLIFLDINMPELTGIQLLKSLSKAPLVILTTAYSEHAIDSYELNVVDYLLKPIGFDRFLKAVMKAKELFVLKSENERRDIKTGLHDEDVVYIKSGTKTFRVKTDTILYVEGLGNYVNFILQDKKIIGYLSMNDVLNLLPPGLFCRIHKSYVVSLKHIDVIEKHQVIIKNKSIPIGLTYRDHFSKIIEKK